METGTDMPRDSLSLGVVDVLRAAQPRLGATALAIVVAGPRVSLCWADAPEDRAFAEERLRHIAATLMAQATTTRTGFITNDLRATGDQEVACKVVVVPLHDAAGSVAGLLVALNRPGEPDFEERALRRATRLGHVLSPSLVNEVDALTGLLTHAAFDRQSRVSLAELGDGVPCSVLYGDIDMLHVVNDVAGFAAGDRMIARVGRVLHQGLNGHRGLASRLSGDRFTVLLLDCTLPQARRIADEVRQLMLDLPQGPGEPDLPASLSWGAAALDGGAPELQHSLAAAEIACKAAKDRGRNRVEVYQEADQSIIRRRDDILAVGSLREALDEERMCIYAQPIVRLEEANSPVGYELLARIQDERGRIVEPAEFMSAATRYQLLTQIDRAIIRQAFEQLDAERGFVQASGFRFSINLSGPTLGDPGFLAWLLAEMSRSSIDGEWLGFEITETAATADLSRARDLIRRLKSRGCRFALDDFGTGVNSLAYLKALEVDYMKLDGSYVRDIVENVRSEALVRAVTTLATSMGIATVAEYVETAAIRKRVTELGVEFGQGFAIGRPVPFAQLFTRARPATSAASG